jgi:hypothetical protein
MNNVKKGVTIGYVNGDAPFSREVESRSVAELTAEVERLREAVAKWRMIADDFATTHRHRLGLDGAWDKCNLAYDKAVRGD